MTRWPSRLLGALVRRRVVTPFTAHAGGKGRWSRFTRAQRHVVRGYRLAPQGWAGFRPALRIALLSDLHVGSHSGDVERHRAICAEVNRLGVDLVLLLGDYMNMMPYFGGRVPPEEIAEALSGLAAPLGVHAVLGNHDWEYDGEAVWRALAAHGIAVHENSGVPLTHNGQPFYLAGLADTRFRAPDIAAALAASRGGEPVLVMSHDPACFLDFDGHAGVMVSGHTHGGQWRLPFLGALWIPSAAPRAWASGLVELEDRALIVTAGIGTGGLPLRLNCPPEIVVIEIGG